MKLLQLGLGLVLAMVAGLAAAMSSFDPLTTAVSFTDVTSALFVVAAAIVGVLVALKGIRWIFKLVGSR